MLKTRITGPYNKKSVEVDSIENEKNALIVATRPLKTFNFVNKFFTNETYGSNMNVNAAVGGTPDKVHNGIDDALWTGSIVGTAGSFDFESTTFYHAGSKSVDAINSVNNDIAQFAKGSSLTLASYVSLTGWIYLTSWSTLGTKAINIFGWNTGTGIVASSEINIGNYIDITLLGAWQKFNISLTDFNFTQTTIDALRVRTVDIGPGSPPDYYLDDIQFEETGSPIAFTIKPDRGTWLYVQSMKMLFADAYAGTLADATMPNLSYNKILGETLTNGINYQYIQNETILDSRIMKSVADILQYTDTKITENISDGTNSMLTIQCNFQQPILLKREDEEILKFLISEDLSGLLSMKISIAGYSETRS